MDGADESRAILRRVLLDRFRLLEASHQKLKEQFEVLLQEKTRSVSSKTFQEKDVILDSGDATSFPGWETVPGGSFSGSPYRSVLEHLGHAVYVNRTGSGEIIYWNCAAEKLFGYKSKEILGQRVTKLSLEEECHPSAPEIIERLSIGKSWSGQLPLKKKSGQIFMAMVTKSPLYEDGELVGIITVSSDAAIFHYANSGNMRNHHDLANEQSNARRINFKKIQWQPRPHIAAVPQIASSVSNLASKVLSRKREDATCNMCGTTTESEEAGVESHNVKADRPPRGPAVKFFSKLHIGAISNSAKVKNEDIQQNSSDDYFKRKEATFETCHQRGSMKSTPDICNLNAVNQAENFPRGTPCNTERKTPDMHMNPAITSKSCSSGAVPGVRQGSFEVHKSVDQLPRSSSQPEELHGNVPNIKSSDLEGASPTPSDSHKIPSSGENVGSVQGSSSSRNGNGTHSVVDSEIRWEDLQLREEIGQGSFAIVYHGVWNGSDVAVKVYCGNQYTEETLLDYRKEIDIMRRLRHPNVLLFMGAICMEEKLAIVTEYMTRGSLFKTLHKSNQSLDVKRRLKMAIDVARGMNYLHHRIPPIVHRDLKSSNLLVDKSWTVKVGDFGLSKFKNTTFLTAKSGRGTPQWMAPEVLRNEPSTEKSDIFSFGVILWELMTERIPWNYLNPLQVVGVVGFMDRRLELPESMDPQVSSIISDCWQSKPEDRPSFEDIIHIMTDLVHSGTGVTARTESMP